MATAQNPKQAGSRGRSTPSPPPFEAQLHSGALTGGAAKASMPNATRQATELERSEESSQTPAEPGASKSGGFSVHMVGPEKVDMLSELPDDVLCKMLRFLDIDSAVHCGMLSTRWPMLIDEKLFQVLCERVYLDQAQVKVLNPLRFKSWRNMLVTRPRVRTNGVYVLETSYIKKPMRDMWTEVPMHAVLEVKYWRYLRFLSGNRLQYACTPAVPPSEAGKLIRDGGNARHKEVCGGSYSVHRGEVHVTVLTSYARIHFRLEISHGPRGHFSHLYLREHSSVAANDPNGTPIAHRIGSFETFAFRRVPFF